MENLSSRGLASPRSTIKSTHFFSFLCSITLSQRFVLCLFQFVLVETVTTALMDRFIKLRNYKLLTVMVLCTIFFLLGLTLTTNVSNSTEIHPKHVLLS